MQVRHGWSAEVAPNRWAKFDITLEEEDLRRLLGKPVEIPTTLAYQLLEVEAERLVYDKLIRRYNYDRNDGAEKLATLTNKLQLLKAKALGDG